MMPRLVVVVLVSAWVACTLWATDDQMRESDQASILTGAVELARGEAGIIGNESYNYDKQFLTYWVVAGVLKATGGGGPDATIDGVVRVGNYVAALLFSLGLMALVLVQREWPRVKVAILCCVLLSPVVAFTGITLSPNLISGGFLMLLLAVLGRGERSIRIEAKRTRGPSEVLRGPVGKGGPSSAGLGGVEWVLVVLLSFAATAARQDVILLMPLLAILVIPFRTVIGVLRTSTLWAMVGGCLLALIAGRVLDPSPTPLPDPFFVFPTFVVFLIGGLGGSLLLIALFSINMIWHRTRETLVLGAAMLIPLVFYACLLYTPRHLFVVALALAASVLLPRGSELWQGVVSGWRGRAMVGFALLLTLIPWVVGVRMTGFTAGRVVISDSGLYPTADGFWPMGAYADFYARLARAGEAPVDHNQEVWAAWASVDKEALPPGKVAVVSSGLASFGEFLLKWHGREIEDDVEASDYVLFDDRTITKRQMGVDQLEHGGQERVGALLSEGRIDVVGRAQNRAVLMLTRGEGAGVLDDAVSLRMALSELAGGNDFRLSLWQEAPRRHLDRSGYWSILGARSPEVLEPLVKDPGLILQLEDEAHLSPWFVYELSDAELAHLQGGTTPVDPEVWIGCGVLPEFMDVGRYGK